MFVFQEIILIVFSFNKEIITLMATSTKAVVSKNNSRVKWNISNDSTQHSQYLENWHYCMLFVQHTKKAFCSGVSSHLSFPSALSESRGRRCLICHHSLVSWPSALSCKHLSCFSAHPSAAGVIVFIDTLCLWHIGVMLFP